jgi:hypothetical protein
MRSGPRSITVTWREARPQRNNGILPAQLNVDATCLAGGRIRRVFWDCGEVKAKVDLRRD